MSVGVVFYLRFEKRLNLFVQQGLPVSAVEPIMHFYLFSPSATQSFFWVFVQQFLKHVLQKWVADEV
jgi:hypothetical protein